MKKLFIVVEGFDDTSPKNANSIVSERVIKELHQKELTICIITSIIVDQETHHVYKERCKYGDVYYVEAESMNDWRIKALNFFNKEFWNKNSSAAILSFSNPIQCSLFSVEVSKKYKINFFQYYLDPHSMSQAVRRRFLFFPIRFHRDYLIHKYAKKIYVTKELYSYLPYKLFFRKFNSKIISLGLPFPSDLFIKHEKKDVQLNEVSISYFGRFYKNIRNPIEVLTFLTNIDENIRIYIYGLTEKEFRNEFNEVSESSISSVVFKGYIPRDEVEKKIMNSDFLVNIGNDVTNQLPSKVLEYASSGKPIINFYSKKNDTSKEFLKKYPLVYNVNMKKKLNAQEMNLKNFIDESLKDNKPMVPKKIYSDISSINISSIIYKNL